MATMQGITGKLSGKMGSAVFRVRQGAQVVTQYNPIVTNPNTKGQQNTRAKFKLLSQLAAVLSAGIGTMGATKRAGSGGKASARNGFFQKNYSLVEIDSTDGVVAKIPMEQVQLTESFREFGEMSTEGEYGQQGGAISVEIELAPGSNVKSGKIALVGFGTMGVVKTPSLIQVVDVPVESGQIAYDFRELPVGDYTVLAYGIIPLTEGASRIDLDNIHTPADEDFIAAVDLRASTAAGDTAETVTIGGNVTISA